ncbi:MAG TPA: addiction module protein, partial [Kofleriaceae bacterium]|nr:addiction module protein [Kofleriaceae bacterium]
MADAAKVLADALDLPARERLRLAGALARSVNPEEDDDAAEAWIAELDRRDANFGEDALVDAPTVHARVREALRTRRA